MGRLSKNNVGFYRRNERERLMFIAAAGLAFSLLIIMVVVLNYKQEGYAKEDLAPTSSPSVQQPAVGSVSLLTFERPVPAGTRLSDVPLKEVFWPRNQIPAGALFDAAEIRNMYAKTDIQPGVPVQREQLTLEPEQFSLPVQPGYRAIGIDVDATSSVEAHTQPGTRVDVLLTYYQEKSLVTEVLVQNARVLSYAGNVGSDRTRPLGARAVGRTMTLEVTPKDALKIQTAKRLGTLSLMLRPNSDNTTVSVVQYTDEEIHSKVKPDSKECTTRGRVRSGGKEYIVGCDGKIQEAVGE